MKPLRELYHEIIASEELKAAFLEAAKSGKALEFLKEQGCEVTEDELKAFLSEKNSGELSDEELDDVAGGCDGDPVPFIALSVVSVGIMCAKIAIDTAMDPSHCC